MKRTRILPTRALLHASHPPNCETCGAGMVTVNWEHVCPWCRKETVLELERDEGGKLGVKTTEVPFIDVYPNRAARRRAMRRGEL